MAKLIPLDGANKVEYQDTKGVRTYHPRRDGSIEVGNRTVADALVKEGLAFRGSATGPVAHLPGFVCNGCGRRNYFKHCGGCNSNDSTKE
jgi:hypothetical protein